MVFHWSLSDGKSPQVSRTLLSILAVLNNAVVWMVSTRPPSAKSSSPFSNPLVTVPNAPITIGIIVTCMFHSFFNSLARSRYLSFFSHSFSFILWSARTAKSTILQVLFFFGWLLLGLVFRPGLLLLLLFYSFKSSSYQHKLMVSHWSLSHSKSTQDFRILLSNLADLNNVVFWMVSTCPVISKSSSLCTNPLVTVLSTPVTIGITVTFMFHSSFSSLARSRNFSPFFSFFQQNPLFGRFSIFAVYHLVWLSNRD